MIGISFAAPRQHGSGQIHVTYNYHYRICLFEKENMHNKQNKLNPTSIIS